LDDEIAAVHTVRDFADDRFVVIATRKGRVKRTALSEYRNIRCGGIIAAGIEKGDEIVNVHVTGGQDQIVLATEKGQVIRFDETSVRPMGRSAAGVKGIELAKRDRVAAFVVPRRNALLLGVTSEGYARVFELDELRVQSRGGKGVRLLPSRLEAGDVIGFLDLLPDDDVVAITQSGDIVGVDPASESQAPGHAAAGRPEGFRHRQGGDPAVGFACRRGADELAHLTL
jgi:DNA gyrase subunit A